MDAISKQLLIAGNTTDTELASLIRQTQLINLNLPELLADETCSMNGFSNLLYY
jgi:hypothetical protein